MNQFSRHIESYRAVFTGFLVLYSVHILIGLFGSPYFFWGIALMVTAYWFAKKTTTHFYGDHHHAGDSALDVVPISVLLLANTLHPAIDGLSWYETLASRGILVGVLYAGSIIVHEIIRQSALISAFRRFHIRWYWIIGTALLGMSSGIATGVFDSVFFHTYEQVADLATLGAYAFILSEFYFEQRESAQKPSLWLVVLGAVLALALSLFAVH